MYSLSYLRAVAEQSPTSKDRFAAAKIALVVSDLLERRRRSFVVDILRGKRLTNFGRLAREKKKMQVGDPKGELQLYYCFPCGALPPTKQSSRIQNNAGRFKGPERSFRGGEVE